MSKELFHIQCTQIQAINFLRTMFDARGIENYIGNGGIHIHLLDNQLEDANEIAETLSKTVLKGMLPKAKLDVDRLMIDLAKQ